MLYVFNKFFNADYKQICFFCTVEAQFKQKSSIKGLGKRYKHTDIKMFLQYNISVNSCKNIFNWYGIVRSFEIEI